MKLIFVLKTHCESNFSMSGTVMVSAVRMVDCFRLFAPNSL